MRTLFTVFFVLTATAIFSQTIRRVNNNPGVTGANIYATIQAAHDAASSGDIIYVEPSPTEYGGLTSTKQLTIIGPGYYLNPATSQNARTSQPIIFSTGSGGSTLMGLEVNNGGYVEIDFVSNITIKRCKLSYVYLARPTNTQSYSNIVITQSILSSFLDYPGFGPSSPSPAGTVSVIQIANNIIGGGFLNSQYSGTITNNTFLGQNNLSVSNFSISNNIWSRDRLDIGPYSFSGTNNTFFNNIASESQFGTANGNLANIDMKNVFVVDPTISLPSGYTSDSRYQIKTGSPSIGAGFGGVDCGAFVGSDSYVLSGVPPYPTITKLINSSTGNSTTPLSVTISTKSNN